MIAAVAGHALALIGLGFWPDAALASMLTAVAISLSLFQVLGRPCPLGLRRIRGGLWELRCSDGSVCTGRLTGGRVLPGVISITFSGGSGGSLVLFPDAFCDLDHKRLRRLLRHRG
ncbi:MAG: hypothetical protein OER80_01225 [Gammaproteobacteria bacterium]|nr:hypothetical protein [Gammaproteobacteria bacterium]